MVKAQKYSERGLFAFLALALPLLLLIHNNTRLPAGTFDLPRLLAWFSCLAGMVGLFALAGQAITGRALGILIDERNRYSLSRLQITLWTILVLGTLYTVFMANIIRDSPATALLVDLDYSLVGLMGISIASFVAAPMVLSPKTTAPVVASDMQRTCEQLPAMQNLQAPLKAAGQVLIKGKPIDARLADLIRGEDIGNATVVDLPRLQMLLITLIVVIAYGSAVGGELALGDWYLKKLPDLHQTLLLLVLASHGGYLTGKLLPSSPGSSARAPLQATRALHASQRASALAIDLQAQLRAIAPRDAGYESLRSNLALAQGLAAQAAALPGRFGAIDFDPDEIARMEGRIDALQASAQQHAVGPVGRQAVDAPAAPVVSKVQRRLLGLGYSDVAVTGVADASTERAIDARLTAIGVEREHLDARPYLFYEEVAQLI